jgi:hypothetical protein
MSENDPQQRACYRGPHFVLKLLVFRKRQTVSRCQDGFHVSRTHVLARARDEDGGHCRVRDHSDHHCRTTGRHGRSARGNATGLSWAGLCVSGARSRSLFHFFKRACQSRTQRRYRDLCYGLRSDRTTTLNVVQRISRICNMARGCFVALSCSLESLVGIHSQLCCFRRLCLHRPAILPGAHATDDTALV